MTTKEKLDNYLRQFGLYGAARPETMGAFGALGNDAFKDIDAKTVELLILTAAIARKCEPCIYAHVANFIQAGGTKDELANAVSACILICGGPGMAYGSIALDVYDELSK